MTSVMIVELSLVCNLLAFLKYDKHVNILYKFNFRSELVNYEKLCEELKQKLRMQASYNLMSRLDGDIEQGLCGQCAKEKAIVVPEGDTQKTAEELANVIRWGYQLVCFVGGWGGGRE